MGRDDNDNNAGGNSGDLPRGLHSAERPFLVVKAEMEVIILVEDPFLTALVPSL